MPHGPKPRRRCNAAVRKEAQRMWWFQEAQQAPQGRQGGPPVGGGRLSESLNLTAAERERELRFARYIASGGKDADDETRAEVDAVMRWMDMCHQVLNEPQR